MFILYFFFSILFVVGGHLGLFCGKFALLVSHHHLSIIYVDLILSSVDQSFISVFSGGFPYPTINDRDLLDFLQEGDRMEKPSNCTDEM